jgi:hypothetical protein
LSERSVPKPTATDWSDALLTSGTEALLGAVRNYIGPIKTPYDKRDLVLRLEAFLRRAETRETILALLDSLDVRILGSSFLLGSVPEHALKDLFAGELPLFELGVRISNLLDRLLLFRYQAGGRRLIAVNPLLEEELRSRVLDPGLFFCGTKVGESAPSSVPSPSSVPPAAAAVDARSAIALFSFLFHSPISTRKGGGLTKRAAERAAALLPELAAAPGDRLGVLARSLSASGVLSLREGEERIPDRGRFARLLATWGEDLPYYLAASIATADATQVAASSVPQASVPQASVPLESRSADGAADALALVLANALEALPPGFVLPRAALARWLRIVARLAGLAGDPAPALEPLEELGILAASGGGLVPAFSPPATPAAGDKRGTLVAEGSHALHLMPEANLDERLFVSCIARPIAVGKVWSFAVERDTVRRAFSAGLSAVTIAARLESMSGSGLPQSFAFSLRAWEEEYRSLRLYRGFVIAADDRQRLAIERSASLGRLIADRLAPGVYFLSASSPEEAVAALAAAGLEAPPITEAVNPRVNRQGGHLSTPRRLESEVSASEDEPSPARRRMESLAHLVGPGGFASSSLGTELEDRLASLRAALALSARSEDERRELADRIERRLVLTERQITQSDPRTERLEAGGLDYLGKVRVVERALREPGDRLEILYRLPGEEPVRALLRPVRLDKNEKGLVLEAEDLGTGGPARVPLGAVSTVRRVRASLFGED